MRTLFEHFEINLGGVGSLNLIMDTIKLVLEVLL